MTKSERLSHALHNEEVCKYLAEKPYHDWVVTTAFYSAIHFVRHRLFPLAEPGEEEDFQNFDQYCKKLNKKRGRRTGKHKLMSQLVQKHLVTIHGQYIWLKETSWSARYNKYQVGKQLRDTALKHLSAIKGVCLSEEEKTAQEKAVEPKESRE